MQWGHPQPRSGEGDAKRLAPSPRRAINVVVSDDDRIAAAQSYIDALASHHGDEVPFAPDCIRIEQGIKTGFSGNHLRRSLNRGPQFRIIAATTPPEYTINGDEVRAVYDVLTKASLGGRRVAVARRRDVRHPDRESGRHGHNPPHRGSVPPVRSADLGSVACLPTHDRCI